MGKFSTTRNAGSCTTCPSGKYQDETGKNFCKSASNCPVGKEESAPPSASVNRICSTCETGKFKETSGNTPCFDCPATCPRGNFLALECLPAFPSICLGCNRGTYKPEAGPEDCTKCRDQCAPGRYLIPCSGFAQTSDTSRCVACRSGQFKAGTNNVTSCAVWKTCASGEYQAAAPTSSSDRVCNACTTCGDNERQLQACGRFADTVCQRCDTACAPRQFVVGGCGDQCANCHSSCLKCSGSSQFQCTACDPGSFVFGAGEGLCERCSDNCLTCDFAADQCTSCANPITGLTDGKFDDRRIGSTNISRLGLCATS